MPLLPIPAWTRKGSQVSLNDLKWTMQSGRYLIFGVVQQRFKPPFNSCYNRGKQELKAITLSLAWLTLITKAYRTAMLHLKLNLHVKVPNEKFRASPDIKARKQTDAISASNKDKHQITSRARHSHPQTALHHTWYKQITKKTWNYKENYQAAVSSIILLEFFS